MENVPKYLADPGDVAGLLASIESIDEDLGRMAQEANDQGKTCLRLALLNVRERVEGLFHQIMNEVNERDEFSELVRESLKTSRDIEAACGRKEKTDATF